jgi:hypothetical protein
VGVFKGDFSEKIISAMRPSKFYAIDLFGGHQNYFLDELRKKDLTHRQWYEAKFSKEMSQGIVEIREGWSWDILNSFPDAYFDFIYLDADHTYKSVAKDIKALEKKMKIGGYIQFNDYVMTYAPTREYFGVIPAVNEFINMGGHEVVYLCLNWQRHFDHDIVVRIKA